MAKKSKSFDPTLFVMLLLAIVFIIVMPTIYTASEQSNEFSKNAKSVDYRSLNESVSPKAMVSLSAEAYAGLIGSTIKLFMDVKNNTVSGWKVVSESTTAEGLEWTFWVNDYDPSIYCLAFAGTDQFTDAKQYIDMELNEQKATQMNQAVEVAKSIPKMIESNGNLSPISKLYLTGHSLGGYLAMYVESELVDASMSISTATISLEDIGELDIDDTKCYTFGAPGMYLSGTFAGVELTGWEINKKAMQGESKYNDYIVNYYNDIDPVANLLSEHLSQLGTKIKLNVRISPVSTIFKFLMNSRSFLIYAVGFTPSLYYHMPWVYLSCF